MNTAIRDEFTGCGTSAWRWKKRNPEKVKEYRRRNLVARREYTKKWVSEHSDYMAQYFREWRKKNTGKAMEYFRAWKKRNPEYKPDPLKAREWYAKYRRNNREKTRAAVSRWGKNNRDKLCAKEARRRARKGVGWCRKNKQIDRIYARAQWWRRWFDVVVDHIVPLSKGGTHTADNLQIIYAFENVKKRDRMDYKPRVIFT